LEVSSSRSSVARVPPLLDLAITSRSRIRRCGSGRSRSRRSRSGIVAIIGVTNDNNSVIELCTAIGVLRNDTALVELEGGFAGIEGDGQRLLCNLCLDLRDGVAWRVHVDGLRSFGDSLARFVNASAFFGTGTRRVGVVLVLHDTPISDELPGGWQEATLATPHTVVLAPSSCICRFGSQGTIDKTLFRETHWSNTLLFGNCSFERGDCSERPTRTALALILGVHNETILVVINGGCVINILNILEATSTTIFSTAIAPRSVFDERVVVLWAYATEKLLVLLRLHIGSEVVAENESVRVSTMCMLAIPVGDHRVVSMVTGLLPLESARVRHVLVVLGAV